MNIIEAKQELQKIISADIKTPVFIAGAPGIAKSSIIAQLAAENNHELIDVRLGRLMPRDLQGLPLIVDGLSSYAPPSFLPNESKPSFLFLDEFNLAVPAIMGIAQELLLDRRIGEYRLPTNCFIFAAGNRKSDNCPVNTIPAAVGNRFIHLEVEPSLDVWLTNYAIPQGISPQIISFLRFRPTQFHAYDKNNLAWPSARSWTVADKLLKAGSSVGYSVGNGAGIEFDAFVRVFESLPNLTQVLDGTATFKAPSKPDLMFAVIASLSSTFTTTKELLNCLQWLTTASPEYVSVFWNDSFEKIKATKGAILAISKEIKKPGPLADFMVKHQYLMGL